MPTRAERVAVVAGFGLLSLITTYPLMLGMNTSLPSDLGDPLLSTWTLAWDASRFTDLLAGVWDAPNFFPYRHTLLYSDHLLGIALFTTPLQWLTRRPVLVYNIAFIASVMFSGIAMYILARALTGRRDAALVAGVIYACLPFRASHLAHLQWLMTGWLPLGVWALHRYFDTRAWRFLAGAAACWFLQVTTATYFLYFGLIPFGVVAGAEMVRRPGQRWQSVRHLAAAVILLALAIAPIVRAYYGVRADSGLRRTVEDISAQSADVADYLRAAPKLRVWGTLGTRGAEQELFPGAISMVLAAVAVMAWRRSLAIPMYASIAALAFVLSLGPSPAAWGHQLGIPGPYGWLLSVVPGLDGIRAVARLGLIVAFALAVLAAFGAARLFDRVRHAGRFVAVAAILAGVIAEGWAVPIPTPAFVPFTSPEQQAAYAYLKQSPAGGALEVPTSLARPERDARYQYLTLAHGHPVVNGLSGYIAPLARFLGGPQSSLNEAERLGETVTALRTVGVRYLVIHHDQIADEQLANAWRALLTTDRMQFIASREFGQTTVVALAPPPPVPAAGTGAVIPPTAIHVEASHSPDRLPFLFDGDLDSRWLSGPPQSGDEWITLEFDRPRDVSAIQMRMAERSLGDYPRELTIDAGEGGAQRLFRGSVLPALIRGLVADGNYPAIVLALPPNRSTTVTLRQRGRAGRFFWSIHELRIWDR